MVVVLVLLLTATIWLQTVEPGQIDLVENPRYFPDTLAGMSFDRDSLEKLVGENKGLPPGYEYAALIAYSAYPELKKVNIDMLFTPYGPPMQANMDIWSLLGPRSGRQYKITLKDTENSPMEPILLRSLPFDAQVGILAHELGHVAYYHRLSTLQIAKWGLEYLRDPQFRATHERTTDMMPIYHGLGSQIYQYAYYVRHDPSCEALYARNQHFMDTFYMTDQEIKNAWDEHRKNQVISRLPN